MEFKIRYLIGWSKEARFEMQRFKTGTPARVNKRRYDFSLMEVQENDDNIKPFHSRQRDLLKTL